LALGVEALAQQEGRDRKAAAQTQAVGLVDRWWGERKREGLFISAQQWER